MNQPLKILILSILVFLFLLVVLTGSVLAYNQNRVILGTRIAGQNYSGLTQKEAEEKLQKEIKKYQNQGLLITFAGQKIQTSFGFLGLEIDKTKVQEMLARGHQDSLIKRAETQLKYLLFSKDRPLPFLIAKKKLHDFFQKTLSPLEKKPQNAVVAFDQNNQIVYLEPGKDGEVFPKKKVLEQIFFEFPSLRLKQIDLKLQPASPQISQKEAEEAFSLAKNIIESPPLTLTLEEKSWQISPRETFSWFSFKSENWDDFLEIQKETYPQKTITSEKKSDFVLWLSFDEEKIKETLADFAPSINQKAQNARLGTNDQKEVLVVSPSQAGHKLKIEESTKQLTSFLYNQKTEIPLVTEKEAPEIDEGELEKLGLKELLAVGKSNFSGSPKSRRHNIEVGTAKFDGLLLEPKQEFSFNTFLGEVGAAQGYLPELVIKNNKTIPEYGGGLCQVSTTVFRAALTAGLEITERFPHAFPVKYYNPQGFDATIYPPHPDLRFVNNTSGHLLLQGYVSGNQLFFEVYGTSDGRQVKINGPYIIESGEDGSLKTILYQEIYKDDKLEKKNSFYSAYKSPELYPVQQNPLE